jgi:hypothetical protein
MSHALGGKSDYYHGLLEMLVEPGQIVELRLLKVRMAEGRLPLTMSGYFDDHRALAAAACKHGDAAGGVYVTLNPLSPALLARAANRLRTVGKDDPLTTDADILRRLPIDLDPVRPAGISSSDPEHESAIARALAIRDALQGEGWPEPIVGDSGNGGRLLYRIDLPSNDEEIVKRCLAALADRFDDGQVKVDRAVFNPSRIWKLYGTLGRKGDNLPERPHRLAQILEAP